MVLSGTNFKIPSEEKIMNSRLVLISFALLISCAVAGAADRKYIVKPRAADIKALPFSDGVLVGNTLYIAGHIGLDPKTGQAPADAEQEAKLVMEGVKATVEQAGLMMDDIVSVQVFCSDLKYYETFNSVYKTYFHDNYPARAFVGAGSLLRNGKFEVLGIAIKKSQ
jgi:2-iminobutanoate/2-iminopropanoate deaminase